MTYYRLKTDSTNNAFILQESNYCYVKPLKTKKQIQKHTQLLFEDLKSTRNQSQLGSDSYSRSTRRAFSRSKLLAFFNPDLNQFLTFTYSKQHSDPLLIVQDIKNFIKITNNNINKEKQKNSIKYIYVMELHKKGGIHVHMVASEGFRTHINKYGHKTLTDWSHGFTNVQTINDFDLNFKPYLYLFKYMAKAQRVGSSFVHISKNFDKIKVLDYGKYINFLNKENLLYQEDYIFNIKGEQKDYTISKKYYRSTANQLNE